MSPAPLRTPGRAEGSNTESHVLPHAVKPYSAPYRSGNFFDPVRIAELAANRAFGLFSGLASCDALLEGHPEVRADLFVQLAITPRSPLEAESQAGEPAHTRSPSGD